MSVDVDAVNERLNGLVTLLQAVGVDSNDVARVSNKLGSNDKGAGGARGGGLAPDARQLNDDQIEAIIRKLQLAQAEAPQIIAALEAHAESRSLNGGGRQQHQQEPEPEEDEEDEDEDEGNYPMVGHGVSDDISVVSDLTTPTVVVGVPVPEEEHYRDTLPPMMVGGNGQAPPMMINPSKRRNLVSQVRPSASMGGAHHGARGGPAGPVGGAAAKRRNNYNSTMAKIPGSNAPNNKGAMPQMPSKSRSSKDRMNSGGPGGAGEKQRVKKKKPSSRPAPPQQQQQMQMQQAPPQDNFASLAQRQPKKNQWESPHNNSPPDGSWNAFKGNSPSSPGRVSPGKNGGGGNNGASPPTVIDNDGFLVGESFDPFAMGGNNPFANTSSAAGDLAFGSGGGGGRPRNASSASSANGERPRRPKSSNSSSGGGSKQRPSPASNANAMMNNAAPTLRQKPRGAASGGRRARRASLAM